jgi:circadian clock protein KaiC
MNATNGTQKSFATGVPGFDEVLGGGLSEYSFSLIAGEAGSGKTTLAQQIVFRNATAERRALYFTVLGEPTLKMLRYLQQMSFFDAGKVGEAIHFVDLTPHVLKQDLSKVLEAMVRHVKELDPAFVVVDSFRTLVRTSIARESGDMELQSFLQRLALHLTSWQTTSFLIGEYLETEMRDNPIFTVADGIFWLGQARQRNSIVRKLQIMKLRGQATMPGLHTFRIDTDGIHVFPRIIQAVPRAEESPRTRQTSGIPGLDALLGGGFPRGNVTLVAGPSGSGKTRFGMQFVAASKDENAVVLLFEEKSTDYLRCGQDAGLDLERRVREGRLKILEIHPLDLSVDEMLLELKRAVVEVKAQRLAIDSLTGFEIALAPTFREDFRESLFRMLGAMTGMGVSVLMTVEVTEAFRELRFTPHETSFLADNLLLLRYAEIDGHLRKLITVVKMRHSAHATALYELEVGDKGLAVKDAFTQYDGLLTGHPTRREAVQPAYPGLAADEEAALNFLFESHEAESDAIAEKTGLKGPNLSRALGRLVLLGYAIKVAEKEKTLYRPLARALGERGTTRNEGSVDGDGRPGTARR